VGAAQKSPDLFQNYTPPGSGNYALTNLNGIQYISIVDERNRRGRPPKSKKPPELEAKERDFKELREKELREKDPNGEDEHGDTPEGEAEGESVAAVDEAAASSLVEQHDCELDG